MADPGFKLNGGFLRDDQDRVVFSSGPVAYEQGGIPVDAEGAIVVSSHGHMAFPHEFVTMTEYNAGPKDPAVTYFILPGGP